MSSKPSSANNQPTSSNKQISSSASHSSSNNQTSTSVNNNSSSNNARPTSPNPADKSNSQWLKDTSWGNMYHFLLSYQLKPYDDEDWEEGKRIIKAFREDEQEEWEARHGKR
ncbi:hypothetical protein HYFRA_00013272 [Hymenoscyphus fraxineus]|uniref:Uncharacterized protein n=1 Tax=Hymenoscyphus fraxineus TaxID=746836 RepID=A0A9N9L9X7_9HELO|nr:hypothetical protein HYFRA_00013272 [Hymenoscyphus fraxineus]